MSASSSLQCTTSWSSAFRMLILTDIDAIGSGTVYTLPYYMGLYHGFIAAD